jgi:hypothetical protein
MDWRSLSVLIRQPREKVWAMTLLVVNFILVTPALAHLPTIAVAQSLVTAGKTIMAKGQVNANNQQEQRQLVRRAPVFSSDLVSTGELSASQLRMIDGALLTMQAASDLDIASYQYNPQTQQGNVEMSLLKGGLRTVTGALQQQQGNYKLTTPVASIGVRGTHYEAELVEGDLYLAGWKGIIDIQVTAGSKAQQFSLGPNQAYQFAIVRANGEVEFLLRSPVAFASGYSNDLFEQGLSESGASLYAQKSSVMPVETQQLADELANEVGYQSQIVAQRWLGADISTASWLPDTLSNITRQGLVTFDQVEQHSVVSSLGEISNFNMSMTINFDSARIPTGNLSFVDAEGEWFAAFDGIIAQNALQLSVNFASHGNNLASGNIQGLLIDQAKGVLGNLALTEVNNSGNAASGGFILRQQQP